MVKLLKETLEQLKLVKVQVHSFSARKQMNLFESEVAPEISFNGYKLTSEYNNYLDLLYQQCKTNLEEKLNGIHNNPEEIKQAIDLHRFAVREFKSRYFPKDNEQIILNRVDFIKTPVAGVNDDIGLKKKF